MNTTVTCDECGTPVSADLRCGYCGCCRTAPDRTTTGCCRAVECRDCGKPRHDVDAGTGRCEPCDVADHNAIEATLAAVSASLNASGHMGSYTPRYIRSVQLDIE